MKTLEQILEGKRVRMTDNCKCGAGLIKGDIIKIRIGGYGNIKLFNGDDNWCVCMSKWQLLDPINYNPPKHKHTWSCSQCGEEK